MSAVLERLVSALALGEGFQLGVLVVEDADGADHALGALMRLLSTQIGRPALILRVGPASDLADPEALALAVLDPLQDLPPSDVVVLDASMATSSSEPAWEEVFRRLNSRRNGFARVLGRALILCVTPRLELALRREAPDLWSVRSARGSWGGWEVSEASEPVGTLRGVDAVETDLPSVLRRLFPDPRDALPMFAELGYPPSHLPLSDTPRFWEEILQRLDQKELPGGIDRLVRHLAMEHRDDPGLAPILERLPRRTRIVPEGMNETEFNAFLDLTEVVEDPVQQPWFAPIRQAVGAGGARIAVVGARGTGRRTGCWEALSALRAAAQKGHRWWSNMPRDRSQVNLLRSTLGSAGGAIPGSQALARWVKGQSPDPKQLALLPPSVADLLASSPDGLASEEALEPVVRALNNAISPAYRLIEASPEEVAAGLSLKDVLAQIVPWWPLTSCVVFYSRPLSQHERDLYTHIVETSGSSPGTLMEILHRRIRRCPKHAQFLLWAPEMRRVYEALATLTDNPGAFLTWIKCLLSWWPLPPPPDWSSPENLEHLVPHPFRGNAALLLGQMLDGVSLTRAEIEANLGTSLEAIARSEPPLHTLLWPDPTDPERLHLAPVAALLKPSVAAALSAQPGSGRFW